MEGAAREERGIPWWAKLLAIALFFGVIAAIYGVIEVVSPGNASKYLTFWVAAVALVYWRLATRVVSRVYGAERVATEKSKGEQGQAKYRAWFLRYFMPFPALIFAVLGGIDAWPAWQAWHGQGQLGWVVAEEETCDRTCAWEGTFRSDDGESVRYYVWIWDPPEGTRVGDKIRAVDVGDRTAVFEATGDGARKQFWLAALLSSLGIFYLIGWLIWVARRLAARRGKGDQNLGPVTMVGR